MKGRERLHSNWNTHMTMCIIIIIQCTILTTTTMHVFTISIHHIILGCTEAGKKSQDSQTELTVSLLIHIVHDR